MAGTLRQNPAVWALLGCGLILFTATASPAADPPAAAAKPQAEKPPAGKPPAAKPAGRGPTPADPLQVQQQQIAERYKHLEEVLLRMAELSAATDPRRAALLRKAVAQSKDRLVGVQFEQIVKLLEKDQLSRAIENQGDLDKDLKALLELLLSENRAKRIESERARVLQYLRRLNELIQNQKSIQGRTAGDGDAKQLSKEQHNLGDKTGRLAGDIKAAEEPNKQGKGPPAESGKEGQGKAQPGKEAAKPGDKSPGDKPSVDKSPEGKSGEKPSAQKPPGEKSAQGKSGDKSPGDKSSGEKTPGGKSSSGKPSPKGSPSPGQSPPSPSAEPPSGDDQQQAPPEQNPARRRLEAAQERMRQAEKRLDEAKRKDATDEQEKALRELQQAKADLEKILRQLREEELERTLAMLEVRFRKILQLQREVYDGTVRLDKTPAKERTHDHEIESARLSSKETVIVAETDKALLLLREDGTSVAFPEAASEMRQDMQQITERLAETKVGKVTQALEQDVITALEEMLDALKQAQKKLEDKKQRGRSSSGQDDSALVDALAELRMIRSMQMRVNTRTDQYSRLIDGEQADKADLVEALRRLAERQERIYQITRELELGKNR